jgi:hypothetical protein
VRDALQDWIDEGFLAYHTMAGEHQQIASYQLCDSLYRVEYDWTFYLDADEYLHVRDQCALPSCCIADLTIR